MAFRRAPHVLLDADAVRKRVADCFRGKAIEDVRLLEGGACNTNYAFRAGREEFVLRIHGRGDPETGARERHVTRLVAALVPVPEVLHLGGGWTVTRFLPGEPLSRAPTPGAARAAGRALAAISAVVLPRAGRIRADGTVGPWPFGDDFTETCLVSPRVRESLGDAAIEGVRRLMARESAVFTEMDADHRLVHGDFNPGNVLVTGDRVTGILDWEFAHAGTSWQDVGNLLRNLGPAFDGAVSEGLREGGMALPPDWRRRASLVDLSSHLEFLAADDVRDESFRARCVARVLALLS